MTLGRARETALEERMRSIAGSGLALSVAAILVSCGSIHQDPEDGIGSTCGNGVLDDGETCDKGPSNSDTLPDACRVDCSPARCGDGVLDTGEACDDGSANGRAPGACRSDCTPAACGDGVVDPGEACDDGPGNGTGPDACRPGCIAPVCGDGIQDTNEECDDGEGNSDIASDACRSTCMSPRCGDGVIDRDERCDEGLENSDVMPGACRTNCAPASCGDGVIDPGEACDDGSDNGDAPGACRIGCIAPVCGDGIADPGEGCDEGDFNSDVASGACRTNCTSARCGDGVVDGDEACDEGLENSDVAPGACRTNCAPAACGDGVIDPGEACDDGAGNGDGPGACRIGCVAPICGDGIVDPNEECDDGAGNGDIPGACRVGCIAPMCGDGIADPGEGCDLGAGNSDTAVDGCRTTCRLAGCGDGVLDTGEECDDDNGLPGDDCTPACAFALDAWSWQKQGVVFEPPEGVSNAYSCPACDGAPALVNVDETLHLFFARLPGSGGYSRTLHHAVSTDGVEFSTPVAVTGLAGGAQLDPTVVHDGTGFRLWYLDGTRIGHAISVDGKNWTMVQGDVLPRGAAGEFDQAVVRYPTALPDDAGGWFLWYMGSTPTSVFSIGRAISDNGVAWTKTGQVLQRGAGTAFDNAAAAMPRVIRHGSGYRMWYGGYDLSRTNPGPWRIGSATSTDGIHWDKQGVSIPLSSTGTESASVREPAIAAFRGGWTMIYAALGDDGYWRLHRATSSYLPPPR